jgi:hypothetical protein
MSRIHQPHIQEGVLVKIEHSRLQEHSGAQVFCNNIIRLTSKEHIA